VQAGDRTVGAAEAAPGAGGSMGDKAGGALAAQTGVTPAKASQAGPKPSDAPVKSSATAPKTSETAVKATVADPQASAAGTISDAAAKETPAPATVNAQAPKPAAAHSGPAAVATAQRSSPNTPVPAAPASDTEGKSAKATGPVAPQGPAARRARRPSAMAAARKVQADIAASGQTVAVQPHEKTDDDAGVGANRVLEAAMDTAGAGIVAPLVQAVAAGSQAAADQAGTVAVPSQKDISKMAHHVADGMVSAAKPAEVGQMVTASFGASFAAFLFVVLALGALSVAGSTVVQILREEFTDEGIEQKKKTNRIRQARRGSV